MFLLFVVFFWSVVNGQQCADSGMGPCVSGLCPTGATCINNGTTTFCCSNTSIITTTLSPTTSTGPTTAAASTTTVAPTTTAGPTTTASNTTTLAPTTTVAPTTTAALTITAAPTTTVAPTTTAAPTTTVGPTTSGAPTTTTPPCVDNSSINCSGMASYCNNTAYEPLMTQYCPLTCGKCNTSTTTAAATTTSSPPTTNSWCHDNVSINCSLYTAYCNNSAYDALLTQQCPVTCNKCGQLTTTTLAPTTTGLGCQDNASINCSIYIPYCNNSAYDTLLTQQCPKTCNKTCTVTTTLAPTTAASGCQDNASINCSIYIPYCNNSAYDALLTQLCPKTCNKTCSVTTTTAPPSTCQDLVNPSTGVSDCPGMASYCNNATYYDVMTQQCPKTCNRCGAATSSNSTCQDLVNPLTGVSDCPGMASYCNNTVYYSVMTQQCPKTCNRCGITSSSSSSGSSSTCVDQINPSTGTSDCPSRAYLCNNADYYSLMTQQCPYTCNRCPTGRK